MRRNLLLLPLLATALTLSACAGRAYFVQGPPPPPPRGYYAPAARPGWAWTDGHWAWRGRWVWTPGRWVRPPRPRAVWVPGYWAPRRHGYVWVEGRWR